MENEFVTWMQVKLYPKAKESKPCDKCGKEGKKKGNKKGKEVDDADV